MAETPAELAERLKAMAKPATTSFVAPSDAGSASEVTELKGDSAKVEDALKVPPSSPDTTTKITKPSDNDVQMANLIKEAEKRNTAMESEVAAAALNNKVIDFGSLQAHQVKAVLKNCGMDSQMVERAYTMLREL